MHVHRAVCMVGVCTGQSQAVWMQGIVCVWGCGHGDVGTGHVSRGRARQCVWMTWVYVQGVGQCVCTGTKTGQHVCVHVCMCMFREQAVCMTMCICVCAKGPRQGSVCMCVHMYVCAHGCMYRGGATCTAVCTWGCVHACVHSHMYAHGAKTGQHVCVHTCRCVCLRLCVQLCVHGVCMCMHTGKAQ